MKVCGPRLEDPGNDSDDGQAKEGVDVYGLYRLANLLHGGDIGRVESTYI